MVCTINRIELGNFKSVRSLDIELAPLTIFVGPNGSGKTTILEAIALMAQSVKSKKSLSESLSGDLVDFEGMNVIAREGALSAMLSLGLSVYYDAEKLRDALLSERISLIRLKKASGPSLDAARSNIYDILISAFRRQDKKLRKEAHSTLGYLHRVKGDGSSYEHIYSFGETCLLFERNEKGHSQSFVGRKVKGEWLREGKNLGAFSITPNSMVFLPPFFIFDQQSKLIESISQTLQSELKGVYYLSAERGAIPWALETSQVWEATWVGAKGQHTLVILARLMKPENDDKRLPYELFAEKFGIKHAWSGWERTNILTSNYIDPFLGSSHKFPSLGWGSRQLLSIIAQLAYSNPGSTILVEEPEMSLHPAYQSLLPALFTRAVQEGKQIIATTHSSYFPLSLKSVLEGFQLRGQTTRGRKRYNIKLNVDDILIYHVTRDKKGYARLEKLPIDDKGLKEGIPSFIGVEKEILGRLIAEE